jgi:hypothetical protein
MPLIAIFAAVDFLLPVMVRGSESESLAGVLGGAVCGQFSLLCLWAVFGAQRLVARWSVSLLVAIFLYGVLLLGLGVVFAEPGPDLRGALAGILILPLLFLGAQVPQWILRMATGWQIVADGTPDAGSPRQSRQFGLQQILGATAAVAVALGLAGLGLPLLDGPDTTPDPSVWSGPIFGGLIYGAWSLLWIVPCLWAAFIARDKAASTAIMAMYAVAMSLLLLILMSILSGGRFDRAGLAFLAFSLFHGSIGAVLLGSLHLLRSGGYVLLRPGRRQPPATPTGSSPFADSSDVMPPSV